MFHHERPRAQHEAPADESPSGVPVRNRFAADPVAMLCEAAAQRTDVRALTAGRQRAWLGSGERRALVLRPGAMACAGLPSRMGDTLRWPDGRITNLYGAPLARSE